MRKIKAWAWGVLIGLDQLFNALCGGWPDETFSSRCHRHSVRGLKFWRAARWAIDHLIFFWQKEHCRASYLVELLRGHHPKEWRRA